jgi:hypothetical protein
MLRLGWALLLLTLGMTTAVRSQDSIPRSPGDQRLLTYEALFRRVAWLEDKGSDLKAQGKSDAFARSVTRKDFGLTAQEQARLTAIAMDWVTKCQPIQDQAKVLILNGQSSTTSPALQSLLNERLAITQAHIDQLQTALGPLRFAAMNAIVMRPGGPKGIQRNSRAAAKR